MCMCGDDLSTNANQTNALITLAFAEPPRLHAIGGRPLSTYDTKKGSGLRLSVLKGIHAVPQEEWDACASASTCGVSEGYP